MGGVHWHVYARPLTHLRDSPLPLSCPSRIAYRCLLSVKQPSKILFSLADLQFFTRHVMLPMGLFEIFLMEFEGNLKITRIYYIFL